MQTILDGDNIIYEVLLFIRDNKHIWMHGKPSHRQWMLDQMVRLMCGNNYTSYISELEELDITNIEFKWSEGEDPYKNYKKPIKIETEDED